MLRILLSSVFLLFVLECVCSSSDHEVCTCACRYICVLVHVHVGDLTRGRSFEQVFRQLDSVRERLSQQASLIEGLTQDSRAQEQENDALRMRVATLENRNDRPARKSKSTSS